MENVDVYKRQHFTHHGKRYFAIAFPNVSGGYEIRNRYFKGCIAPQDVYKRQPHGTARYQQSENE